MTGLGRGLLLLILLHRVKIRGTAQRFVFFGFAQHDEFVIISFTKTVIREISGAGTTGFIFLVTL
jgi:hypothetical protein